MLRQQIPREQIRKQNHDQRGQRPVPGLPVEDLHHGDDPLQGQQGTAAALGVTIPSDNAMFQLRSSLTENPPSSITIDGNSQVRAA